MRAVVTPTELGSTVAGRLVDGQFENVHQMLAPWLQDMVPADLLPQSWQAMVSAHGAVRELGAPTSEPAGPATTVVSVPICCERGEFAVIVSVDAQSCVTGLNLRQAEQPPPPDWSPPQYADPTQFSEHGVTVGVAAALPVDGTLSLPDRRTPVPVVLLLPGSGPTDRDGTLGPNKFIKDLAWGLATRGIATLRYDKAPHSHPDYFRTSTNYTVQDEYIDHAVAAVELLRTHPAIDPTRVHLLGHSLGATVAPRIAAAPQLAWPRLAGLIILAGGTQRPHHSALRQYRYLAGLNPSADVDGDPTVDKFTRQVKLLDSPQFRATTPAEDLPFALPAAYWLDLLAYDPVATAAQLDIPMLILQGARDYQVTLDDDLVHWRSGLAGRSDVRIRVYPDDDHQFFPGTGRSTPVQYRLRQHVDPAVIADIAEWITT